MRGFFFTVIWILGLGIVGCATSAPPAPTRAPLPPAPTLAPAVVPTALPTNLPAADETAMPQVNLGETKTYRDEIAGFEFDYPATWSMTPVADEAKKSSVIYSATFFSWKPTGGSSEGIPAGGTKIDVGVIKNNAASPEEALALRKQEMANGDLEQTVLSEQAWTLPSGLKAARLQVKSRFGESAEVVTAINGRTILFGGVGDYALIDAVARTLRPIATSGNN